MRERLEQHRVDPTCASCHNMMDPIGFALENFDSVGKFRVEADGAVVDTSGMFWDGSNIEGPGGLHGVLMARSELFVENFTEKLLTYALGRKVEYTDMPQVREVLKHAEAEDYRFNALVKEIALSTAFTHRATSAAATPQNSDTAQR